MKRKVNFGLIAGIVLGVLAVVMFVLGFIGCVG